MKTKNTGKQGEKITLAKRGIYWVILGPKYDGPRQFSTEFAALEFAETIWPGCDCVYEAK